MNKAELEAEVAKMRKNLEQILQLASGSLDEPYRKLGTIMWLAKDALGQGNEGVKDRETT